MAGIDNITNEILQDAENSAAELIREAEGKKSKALEEARAEAEKLSAAAKAKADADAASYIERATSQAESNSKRAVLSAKSGLINDIIAQAHDKLLKTDDRSYFDMIYGWIEKTAHKGEGTVLVNASDRKRLPSDFSAKISAAAAKNGGTLKLSDENADIDGGFILKYGGIDENCSLSAIFDEKRTELEDLIYGKLWPKE